MAQVENSPLVRELVARGVTETTARELVGQSSAETLGVKIEVFDWLGEKKDQKIKTNPAGYLVDSIRKNYAPPKGFESKAQRHSVKRKRPKPAARPRTKSAARPNKKPVPRLRRKPGNHGSRLIGRLTPTQQAKLMEAALAADPKKREDIEHMRSALASFVKQMEKGVRDHYIESLLAEKASV